jgi:hypothetical protein
MHTDIIFEQKEKERDLLYFGKENDEKEKKNK